MCVCSSPQTPPACWANNCFTSSWSLHSTTDVFAESNASEPQIRNTILARKLCVEGCNTCFNEAQPSSHFSHMTMAFYEVELSRGNKVRLMCWSNIFEIQWLYLYYSINISLIYNSIDSAQYLQENFNMPFKYNVIHLHCFLCNLKVYLYINTILLAMFLPLIYL